MTATRNYRFRRANVDDLALLRVWQLNPHVREWWGADEPYTEADLADPRVAPWIVSFGRRPFAFMQDYTVHGWGDHHFAHLPQGTRGIDQFIGEPDMVGVGHGSAFIGTRMQALFDEGAPIIATDPHPDNARAVAVYKKLGFKPSGPLQETEWGLVLPMTARR
ncbi:GNAT family N-acetyltransferase [Anianabacter salinae]|uniref:GNAT family N-acetyltransferase n=1 Tax=Anianabacter salinae TaxID=2851023 RepID=UPI00225E3DBA|nr:GNAT family N-acetyltransferase [Anianabacter salinae]MBV0912476.1 acetyltransferase [Anianabacter salinae]